MAALTERIIEGPNFFIRTYTSSSRILVVLKRQVRYTIHIFEGNSPVAKYTLKGRTRSVEKVEEIARSHLGT